MITQILLIIAGCIGLFAVALILTAIHIQVEHWWIKRRGKWIWTYGSCSPAARARRHRLTGEVQFVLWKAGEHGHREEYWHAMDSSHWPKFIPDQVKP